ncbi:tetratricopeptide repeat protein [candidate division WWE3 bacterium]|uniref:Tetratricopeptide repeat protein n=1 Tax=candidate division WWE3 bacterium TaxID=2053526 RepID=A0A7X9HGJ1_UNCKA|nr:tetratricopeptide repeat protein [candidate division WWE3 bacterium]
MKKKRKSPNQGHSQEQKKPSVNTSFWADYDTTKKVHINKETVRTFLIEQTPFILLVFLISIVVYGNSLAGDFLIADDIPGLVQNPTIVNFQKALDTGKINTIIDSGLFQIGKQTPYIFHVRSVILHAINAILVYFLASLIFNKSISLASSLLFLVHPINTEAVSWISAWIYLALTLFTLLVTISFLLYRRTGQKGFMVAAIVICATYILFFTDNWVFTIPLIVIIVDQLLVERKINFKVIKNYIPLLTLGGFHAVFLLTTSLTERINNLKNLYYNDVSQATPFIQRVPYTAFMTWKQYVWPKDLTIYHEGYVISEQYFAVMVAFTIVVTGLIIYFLFKNKVVAGLMSLLWVSTLPSFSPIPVAWLMADRYLYRGSMFFSMLIALFIYYLEKKYKLSNFLKVGGTAVFLAYSTRTVYRNADWQSDKNLWNSTLKVAPYSARVYNNLGDVYFKEHNFQKAIEHFQIALQLKPDFADVVHNLGYTYLELGNYDLAREYLVKSYEMNPYLYQSLYKLGFLEYKLGNLDQAEMYFSQTLQVNPGFEPAVQAVQAIKSLKLQQGSNKEPVK